VLSGEFDLLALSCGVAGLQVLQHEGMPISFTLPADAPIVNYYSVGVPKGATHLQTATLFVLFLLSDVGQRLLYETDFRDLHLLPGSQSIALVRPILEQGVRLMGEDSLVNVTTYAEESGRHEKELQRLLAKQ
jgi:ABC-type Fe3+ transport system substrate-binding protein